MLTCREVARRLASASGDDRAPKHGMMMRLHLILCGDCRRYARELRSLGAALRGDRVAIDPQRTRNLEQRILDMGFPDDG